MTLSKLTGLLPKVLQGHFIFYASNAGYNYFIGEFYSGDFFFCRQTLLVLIGLSLCFYSHPLLQLVGCPMRSLIFLRRCQMTGFLFIYSALRYV